MTLKNFKLIETGDGSLSLWNPELEEGYHNRGGAYTESKTVYTEASNLKGVISQQQPTGLHLLDACFGLGYNTWSWLQALLLNDSPPVQLHVTAIELDTRLFETWPGILRQPCYPETPFTGLAEQLEEWIPPSLASQTRSHLTLPFGQHELTLEVCFASLEATLPELVRQRRHYHWGFHDAFSPKRMPELWRPHIFESYFQLLRKQQGECLTYSCARQVRDNLSAAGFQVEKLPGPLGKKHSIKAFIPARH